MRIVIVDDDQMLLRSLKLVLHDEGHDVACYSRGDLACEYIEAGARMDVLILDFVLADSTGTELLRHLRGRIRPDCHVVLVTGHPERLGPSKILNALGVDFIMTKPLDLEQLRAVIGATRSSQHATVGGREDHAHHDGRR